MHCDTLLSFEFRLLILISLRRSFQSMRARMDEAALHHGTEAETSYRHRVSLSRETASIRSDCNTSEGSLDRLTCLYLFISVCAVTLFCSLSFTEARDIVGLRTGTKAL